jgi:N-acetylglucosamine kinase-like BadF-type ATPase
VTVGGLLAGVDAGGSHTEVVLADRHLAEVARARGAAAAVRPGAEETAADAVAATIADALRQAGSDRGLDALVVGAAGVGRVAERDAFLAAVRARVPARHVAVATDLEIALASAFPDTPGILLLAGSGSIACARDAAGTMHRVGGHGWQLGDEGSGYALGRAALAAVGRAADGRGPATLLSALVLRAAGVGSFDDLVRWAAGARPQDVAALAQTAQEAARRQDAVAVGLVRAAARDLALHVRTMLDRLPGTSGMPVVLGGGTLIGGSPLRAALTEILEALAPSVQIADRSVDPARGALGLAARLAAGP